VCPPIMEPVDLGFTSGERGDGSALGFGKAEVPAIGRAAAAIGVDGDFKKRQSEMQRADHMASFMQALSRVPRDAVGQSAAPLIHFGGGDVLEPQTRLVFRRGFSNAGFAPARPHQQEDPMMRVRAG